MPLEPHITPETILVHPDLGRRAHQCLPLSVPGPGVHAGQPGAPPPVSSHSWGLSPAAPKGSPQPRARAPSPDSRMGHVGSSSEDCPLGSGLVRMLCPHLYRAGRPLQQFLSVTQETFSSLNTDGQMGRQGLPFRSRVGKRELLELPLPRAAVWSPSWDNSEVTGPASGGVLL